MSHLHTDLVVILLSPSWSVGAKVGDAAAGVMFGGLSLLLLWGLASASSRRSGGGS